MTGSPDQPLLLGWGEMTAIRSLFWRRLQRAHCRPLPHLPEFRYLRRHRETLDLTRCIESSLPEIEHSHAAGDERMEEGERDDVFLGLQHGFGHSIRPVATAAAAWDLRNHKA